MKYLLGLIIISLYILFIDSYFIVAILAISTIFIISRHDFSENKITDSIGQLVVKLFALLIVVFVLALFLYMEGERDSLNTPPPICKKLNIVMKNNNPCFYIEPFEKMEEFNIYGIQVAKHPMPYEHYWGSDTHKKIDVPISLFTSKEQCLAYGNKNRFFNEPSKELKINVLYGASMNGERKSISKEKNDANLLSAIVWFYLSKNPKTGEIKAVELSGSQLDDWKKNMNDQNKKNRGQVITITSYYIRK